MEPMETFRIQSNTLKQNFFPLGIKSKKCLLGKKINKYQLNIKTKIDAQ